MTDRYIIADASKVSGAEFARSLGLRIRTPAEKQAEWDARVHRYVELILSGCELSEYGNPAVREAKELIALRDADSMTGDPLGHLEPKRKVA
jgi:hypothetical protein